MSAPEHIVQFYDGDRYLLDEVARFLQPGFVDGGGIVVIATEPHRRGLEGRFRAGGFDVAGARSRGRYRELDASATLARINVDGAPDVAAFERVIGGVLAEVKLAGEPKSPVRSFGEMVAILWAEARIQSASDLEAMWNELARRRAFSLFCAYPIRAFRREQDAKPFLEICAAHTHVVPAESYTRLPSIDERFRSVTTLQQKAQAMETAIAELADQARKKDEFLAMLGHELRNPLSAVRNAIATASLDDSRRPQALEIARRQTDQLGHLIDDLLDVARVTGGRITLRKRATTVEELVDRSLETARPTIEDRGHRLNVTRQAGLRIETDPARFEQVLVNLLTNAAKFTPPGGTIDLEVRREGSDAVFRVADTGVGIAPDLLPGIFDLFKQADHSLDRPQGGLGVGLTLARRIVELHGGRIEARSEGVGKGAELIVRIPALDESVPVAPPAIRPGALRSRGLRVLMVEDNPDGAESMRMLLALLGYHVRVVGDGASALRTAHETPPDVMLVDIGLPGMDGYEVARRIRGDEALSHVRLVALTGYGRAEDRNRALEAGFDAHLVKPVELTSLQEVVEQQSRDQAAAMPARAAARGGSE